MKRVFRVLLLAGLTTLLGSGVAFATYINPLGEWGSSQAQSLQGILDSITTSPVPGKSSLDAADYQNDALLYDQYWSITASGGALATFIVEVAGFAPYNSFGLYDSADPSKKAVIFSGSNTQEDQSVVSIKADGSVFVNFVNTGVKFAGNSFGFFLDTPEVNTGPGGYYFYSDSKLNPDGFDHMVAFQGNNQDFIQIPGFFPGLWTSNEYILAWEDLLGGGDKDYNDLVLMVESVRPLPEPASLLLLGTGLLGLAYIGRRKLKW